MNKVRNAQNRAFTKSAYKYWSEDELNILFSHPELTAKALSELLPGRTPEAIACKRKHEGRWMHPERVLCVVCHERPIWLECGKANKMKLCKGCYLDEQEKRVAEANRHNALRQSEFKLRKRLEKQKHAKQ